MSSRPLLIAGIAGGILAGLGLFVLALALIAVEGAGLSGPTMALLVLVTMLGFVLDATWLCLAVDRLRNLGPGNDGEDGGDGPEGPGPKPDRPRPPFQDPDWWPEFEREFRSYGRARERNPVSSKTPARD